MTELTYRKVKRVMIDKGYKFFTRPYSVNLIGIRTLDSTNEFSDVMCVLYIDEHGIEQIFKFPCTTKAGKHWLTNPFSSKGTAILMEGQYPGAYKIGLHNRTRPAKSYQALEQKSNMKYFRDNNKDSVHDYTGPVYVGNYKTNIHRAAESGWSKYVDKWSAGCQVITGKNQIDGLTNWAKFLNLCKLSARKYGNSFTYTLLSENDF